MMKKKNCPHKSPFPVHRKLRDMIICNYTDAKTYEQENERKHMGNLSTQTKNMCKKNKYIDMKESIRALILRTAEPSQIVSEPNT
jgi:hypothetical protein